MLVGGLRSCVTTLYVMLVGFQLLDSSFSFSTTSNFDHRRTFSARDQYSYDLSTSLRAKASSTNEVIEEEKMAKVGDLLGKLPTPSLLLELSLMEKYLLESNIADHDTDSNCCCSVDDFLANPNNYQTIINGENDSKATTRMEELSPLFVHTSVTSTAKRDAVVAQEGSGKSLSVCDIDTPVSAVEAGDGAYLGLGLANHHVGGYYWARSMGIGASLPAHGIYFGASTTNPNQWGELYWKKRGPGDDPSETTEESSNSNDGKRSEWADFLTIGDTIQLVVNDPYAFLVDGTGTTNADVEGKQQFNILLGIRRAGRPLGADPIVEKIWIRKEDGSGWELQQ